MPVINHLLSISKPHAELIVLCSLDSLLRLHLYIYNLRMNWFKNFIAVVRSILRKRIQKVWLSTISIAYLTAEEGKGA